MKTNGINTRFDTSYTYEDLVYLTLESIGYEHSNVNGLNHEKVIFRDTLNLPYSESNVYNSSISATIFNIVLDQLKSNAAKINNQPYYLGSFLQTLEQSGSYQTIEMISVFSLKQDGVNGNELSVRGPILNPINMPESRYFGSYGDCTLEEAYPGAATYLRDWILDNNDLNPPLSPGYYVGDQNWIVSADPDATTDVINMNGTISSYYMTNQMLADNPNDFVQDGHVDRVTYYYYHDTEEPITDFFAATCVSPEELRYYAPTARTIFLNTIAHYNYDILLAAAVEDTYSDKLPPTYRYRHVYWKFTANVGKLKYSGEPTPQTPL
ncbi:MAG: hypothetical protein LCH44_14470 [Bacteroidetes bacterium]|nr:hypothetical protein [Bacteroidota bacterium]